MDQSTFQNLLADLDLGWIKYIESTSSTNDLALDWVQQGAPHSSVVATDHQTQGRGRSGRTWFTYPGTALAFSIIIRPEIDLRFFSRFTTLGAIAVSQTLGQICNTQPKIKWPNDVLLQRKKTAGILTEIVWNGNLPAAVVIGIGVNIHEGSLPPKKHLNFPGTYVAAHTNQRLNRFQILHGILTEIKTWYSKIKSTAFIEKWEESLAFRGEIVTALIQSSDILKSNTEQIESPPVQNPIIRGTLIGINSDGLLILELDNGQIQHFAANEIKIQENA